MVKKSIVLCGAILANDVSPEIVVQDQPFTTYEKRAEAFAQFAFTSLAGGFVEEFIRAYLRKSPHVRGYVLKMLLEYIDAEPRVERA